MRNELIYDQVLDRLPAYALGALEPEEMLAVDAYIRKHQALLARLRECEQATTQLTHLAPTSPLPVDAKQRLMKRVRDDLEAQGAEETQAEAVPNLVEPVPAAKPRPLTEPAGIGRWLAGFRATIGTVNGWALAAGCALVALVVVSLYAGQAQRRLRQVETDRQAFQAEVVQLQRDSNQLLERLRQVETDRDGFRTDAVQLQQANQSLLHQLQTEQNRLDLIANAVPLLVPGTEDAPGATGILYHGPDDQALFVAHGLAPLPPQQTYQLWLITPTDEIPIPAGLLTIEAEPNLTPVAIPAEARDFAAVGVSIEPTGGSPVPTGPIVLLGTTTS